MNQRMNTNITNYTNQETSIYLFNLFYSCRTEGTHSLTLLPLPLLIANYSLFILIKEKQHGI